MKSSVIIELMASYKNAVNKKSKVSNQSSSDDDFAKSLDFKKVQYKWLYLGNWILLHLEFEYSDREVAI